MCRKPGRMFFFFSQGQEDPQRDLGGGVGVKRGCLVILGKAFISGFSSGSKCGFILTDVEVTALATPTPTPSAYFCVLPVCSPQKSWPLISREFLAEVVITDDSAQPSSSLHRFSVSAFSSLPHLFSFYSFFTLPLHFSLDSLSIAVPSFLLVCVCVCVRESRRM